MNALVLGGSGGIGRAFVEQMSRKSGIERIHATWNSHEPDSGDSKVSWYRLDATREEEIEGLCRQLGEIDISINAIGMLHDDQYGPEKSTRQISADYFSRSIEINTLPTLLLARHLAPNLKHKRPAHFATVSARVGSIEENYLGGWYSYRASKAALNMILKTLSIEWKRSLPNVVVSALHPGTTDTALSKPFQKQVPPGNLFTTAQSAAYMMQVLQGLSPKDSGNFWSFDGERLPW